MENLRDILQHLPTALLVIFRIGGLAIFAPLLGSALVTIRIRAMIAFTLGMAVYPALIAKHPEWSVHSLDLVGLLPLIGLEITLGATIGFMASIPLVIAQTGGLVMGQQMGLGFARFYNPAIDDEGDVLGQVLFLLALAGFVLIGGLESMFTGLLYSFEYVPPGGLTVDGSVIAMISGLLLAAFELALRIAAPLLALIFLETVAMGFVSKTVPQLNIISLGFPLRIMVGFLIVAVGLGVINEVMLDGMDEALDLMHAWIGLRGAG